MIDSTYVNARRVLLDGLFALAPHRDNLILVGAQAIYLHTGDGDLHVPLSTTDSDIALDASKLAESPEISAALQAHGFVPGHNPGNWLSQDNVAIDIMVAPYQSPRKKGSRAAKIPPHEPTVARITRGLEPALVDNRYDAIKSLDIDDKRVPDVRVAGPAALLIAKAIKVSERVKDERQSHRVKEKDALDMFRILQAIPTADLVTGLELHQTDPNAATTSGDGLDFISGNGLDPNAMLPQLASRAALDDPIVPIAFAGLANQLFTALSN
ncbi:MAG: hypothetical protein FWG25_06200 [Promicromonosporaceae bacterium]|nr:hypothetical protein [Promicromonosporaceae bacterium]